MARLDKSLDAIAAALKNLARITRAILKEKRGHTGLLHEIRDAVKPRGNGRAR